MTFNAHAEEFAGKPVVDFERGQSLSDPETLIYRIRVDFEDQDTAVDLLTELLEDPQADRLSGLVIGAWSGELYETPPTEVVEALVSAAGQLASLTALFLGDIIYEENEVSWIQQCDLSTLWPAFPRLEHFKVRGSQGLQLGQLRHSRLKSLVLESGGLPRTVLAEIAAAKLPALEHLELWLGDDGYGWDGTIDDVRPLLAPDLFPKLKYLGLRNSQIADEIAKVVAESPLPEQLEVLDLSLGTLGDEGGLALLESKGVLHLRRLDLSHHYMSDEVAGRFRRLGIEVDVSDRQDEGDYGRYVSIGE